MGGYYFEGFSVESKFRKEGLGGANKPDFLRTSATGRVDCWITLGTHPEVQNLSVAFSVLWFPKDLIIHRFAIYC